MTLILVTLNSGLHWLFPVWDELSLCFVLVVHEVVTLADLPWHVGEGEASLALAFVPLSEPFVSALCPHAIPTETIQYIPGNPHCTLANFSFFLLHAITLFSRSSIFLSWNLIGFEVPNTTLSPS